MTRPATCYDYPISATLPNTTGGEGQQDAEQEARHPRRRQQILGAARRCFTRDNFQATSMQDTFAEAGRLRRWGCSALTHVAVRDPAILRAFDAPVSADLPGAPALVAAFDVTGGAEQAQAAERGVQVDSGERGDGGGAATGSLGDGAQY